MHEMQKSNKENLTFPVVGIGASAGGLEALEELFRAMPPKPGCAFVIIQHLSPDYKSLMDELLARYTTMKIHRVEHGMKIQENHIYLIPAKMNMTISEGCLLLSEQLNRHRINLPIDIFLQSLAKDQEKNAIGIILSGTGSDGTLGIRAIKEYGGIAMVQDDQTAKFDGMPRSSISTGMVDFILSPSKLADELVTYVKHPFIKKSIEIKNQIQDDEKQLLKIIAILRNYNGVDFSNYKENTIIRRLEKRISINRFSSINDYSSFLENNKQEIDALMNDLLIGVTRFFRDDEPFKRLYDTVFSQIFATISPKQDLRIWTAGCSTGEEVYSLAILLHEYMTYNNSYRTVKIFATDIDSNALEIAGIGLYPESVASDLSPERLAKYFIKKEGSYQINETIRSMIIFARHDVLRDPPFSKINLISCRNLLIYLTQSAQQRVLSLFHLSLSNNGFLFLGSSESLGNLNEGFVTIDNKNKFYQQKRSNAINRIVSYGLSNQKRAAGELHGLDTFHRNNRKQLFVLEGIFDEILTNYLPPSVILDEKFNIIHSIHRVSKYISLPMGQVSLNILKMLSPDLSAIISNLLRKTQKTKKEIVMTNISTIDDQNIELTISGKQIKDKKTSNSYYLLSFKETDKHVSKNKQTIETVDVNKQYLKRIEELEKELQFKGESLQATVEELETSNEELQSSNEELIASNEELQSTNEELQSVNEELYTVNSEHIKKIEELTELNADIDNLLRNTKIGTIFLDSQLCIRKTNDVASKLTNIRVSDFGRPITHLSLNLLKKDFFADLESVSETLQPVEKELFFNKNWYLMRIIPYRTSTNAVEGIIIIFINITSLKDSEKEVNQITKKLDMAMKMGRISWWNWNYKNHKVMAGDTKSTMLGYTPGEVGKTVEDWCSLIHPDDYKKTMKSMQDHLLGITPIYETEYRIKTKTGRYKWYRDRGGITERDENNKPSNISGVVMDITDEIKKEKVNNDYEKLFQTLSQGIVYQNKKGEIENANAAAENILGLSLEEMKTRTSKTQEWEAIYPDESIFPGEKHPAMIALKTGKIIQDVVMGIYNPQRTQYIWIRITAIPLFNNDEKMPSKVYAVFTEIKKPT